MAIVFAVISIICALVSFWQGMVLMGFAQMLGEGANFAAGLEDAVMSVMICVSTVAALLGAFGALARRWWSWLAMLVSPFTVLLAFIVGAFLRHEIWWTFLLYTVIYCASAYIFKFRASINKTAAGSYVGEAIYGSTYTQGSRAEEHVRASEAAASPRQPHEAPSSQGAGISSNDKNMLLTLIRAKPSSRIDDLLAVLGDPQEVHPAKGEDGKLYYKWHGLISGADFLSIAEGGEVRLSRWTLADVSLHRLFELDSALTHEFGASVKEWTTKEGKKYLKFLPRTAQSSVVLLGYQNTAADITIQHQTQQH